MFCEKCGTQLPDGAKFCENCGNPTDSVAAPAASTPKAPSAFALALKKFFSKKSNLIISIAALLLIIAVIVTVIVIACQPKKHYLDDCIEFTFYGANGYGSVDINVDQEKLEKFEKELFTKEELVGKLGYLVDINFDCENGTLKNGDKVTISLEFTEEAKALEVEKFIDGILTLRKKTITVKGLTEPVLFDLTAFVKDFAMFKGFDGHGSMVEDVLLYEGSYNGGTVNITSYYNSLRVYFDLPYSSEVIYFYTENAYNLSNGDELTFKHNVSEDTKEYLLRMGIILTDEEYKIEVNGLTELISFDVASSISPIFSGYNGYGKLDVNLAEEKTFDCGEYTVTLSGSDYDYYFNLTVTSKSDPGNNYSATYYADKSDDLTNGDKITFTTYHNEYIESYYGILIPESFEIEVSGLEEAINPNVFENAVYDITGFNGYGIFTLDIPEDKRVYSIGDYTFKLTPSKKSYSYVITVVVSDKDGKNIISVNYTTYNIDNLENGNTIEFSCSAYNSTREEYLTNYGINFPESYTIIVSDLSQTTSTNPLDYVKFSFSGENGSIAVNASLTQTSYTVGNYTFTLTVTENTSWWYNYVYINVVVTDETGAECASGKYYTSKDGYSEGDTAYVYSDFDEYDIAKEIGLVINSETEHVIVSTQ